MKSKKNYQDTTETQPQNFIDIRDSLKAIVSKELEELPTNLQKLEPKERVNILCKMLPFIFPKVEAVNATIGEPLGTDFYS